MSTILAVAGPALSVLALFVALVVVEATRLILKEEYSSWSSALARVLVRLAGLLYRPRRGEWWADLLHDQKVLKKSGLGVAADVMLQAPRLVLQQAATKVRTGVATRSGSTIVWISAEATSSKVTVLLSVVSLTAIVGGLVARWVSVTVVLMVFMGVFTLVTGGPLYWWWQHRKATQWSAAVDHHDDNPANGAEPPA